MDTDNHSVVFNYAKNHKPKNTPHPLIFLGFLSFFIKENYFIIGKNVTHKKIIFLISKTHITESVLSKSLAILLTGS